MNKTKWMSIQEATQHQKRVNGVLTNIPLFKKVDVIDGVVYGEVAGYLDEFGNKVTLEIETDLLH